MMLSALKGLKLNRKMILKKVRPRRGRITIEKSSLFIFDHCVVIRFKCYQFLKFCVIINPWKPPSNTPIPTLP